MKAFSRLTSLGLFILVAGTLRSAAESEPKLRLIQTIPLPAVRGRIDHLAIDPVHRRLFLCALGNDSLDELDLNRSERIRSLALPGRPQGASYISDSNQLVATSQQRGTCDVFDATSLEKVGQLQLGDDADNLRYDAVSGRLYAGFGDGGLAVIDSRSMKQISSIMLGAHPEAFALERDGKRIFVNLPDRREVAVINREGGVIEARWKPDAASHNFPMTLDEAEQRLFVGCREPSVVIVLDTGDGQMVARIEISGDVDDLFYDEKHRRLYAICGAGFIDVVRQLGPDSYQRLEKTPTVAGARTGLLVPELDELFVALPRRGSKPAEIRGYKIE